MLRAKIRAVFLFGFESGVEGGFYVSEAVNAPSPARAGKLQFRLADDAPQKAGRYFDFAAVLENLPRPFYRNAQFVKFGVGVVAAVF